MPSETDAADMMTMVAIMSHAEVDLLDTREQTNSSDYISRDW